MEHSPGNILRAPRHETRGHPMKGTDMESALATDPVCGMSVDPSTTQHASEHGGQTHYFCSATCKSAFDTDPDRYTGTSTAQAHGDPPQHHGGHHGESGKHRPGAATADTFSRDTSGLPDAGRPATVQLHDAEVFELAAAPVRKRIADATVRMLAYNGSIPGPTLLADQFSEVTVKFRNELDLESTVHWHGLRHENRFDGVPAGHQGGVQPPVPPGGSFTYRLKLPDPGIFWYHPHIREDYTQEHGLYGAIIVAPSDPSYWPPANREASLMLDDVLMEDGQIAAFSRLESNSTAMGRFGNVMLVNGEPDFHLDLAAGEVVRLYLTNTANTRFFNVRIPGARLKLVGGDNGRVEREQFVEEVLIAPAERAILDVLFEGAGRLALEHHTPEQTYQLARLDVAAERAEPSHQDSFNALRSSPELEAERARIAPELSRPPDKTLALVGTMPGMAHHAGMGGHGGDEPPAIEWEDTMERMNRMSTPATMHWRLVDRETGDENDAISWAFDLGARVKIRIVNELHSDHPMPHPFHIHGERFLVLSRDGVPNANLAWKDTVLAQTGETVDILMEASNPGVWMAHCHIAEHLEGGMMFSFRVGE